MKCGVSGTICIRLKCRRSNQTSKYGTTAICRISKLSTAYTEQHPDPRVKISSRSHSISAP